MKEEVILYVLLVLILGFDYKLNTNSIIHMFSHEQYNVHENFYRLSDVNLKFDRL